MQVQPILATEIDQFKKIVAGDSKLAGVLLKVLNVEFEHIPDMHQFNFEGSINGIMESNLMTPNVVSLHHLGKR